MSGRGPDPVGDVREWSGGPPECPGLVGRPSCMSASGRDALGALRERSGGLLGCPGVVGRPSRMSGTGLEVLPDVLLQISVGHLTTDI